MVIFIFNLFFKPSPRLDKKYFSGEFVEFIDICLNKESVNRGNFESLLEHKFIQKYVNEPSDSVVSWLNKIVLV